MSFEQIIYESGAAVATVTLNRPDRLNAYTAEMHDELIEAFDRADGDDDVRAVVFTRRGITPEACSSWFLPRIVGISQAMEWAATGRLFPASEALRAGLVRSIHPRDGVVEAARELASKIVPTSTAWTPARASIITLYEASRR